MGTASGDAGGTVGQRTAGWGTSPGKVGGVWQSMFRHARPRAHSNGTFTVTSPVQEHDWGEAHDVGPPGVKAMAHVTAACDYGPVEPQVDPDEYACPSCGKVPGWGGWKYANEDDGWRGDSPNEPWKGRHVACPSCDTLIDNDDPPLPPPKSPEYENRPPHKGHGCGIYARYDEDEIVRGYGKDQWMTRMDGFGKYIKATLGTKTEHALITGIRIPHCSSCNKEATTSYFDKESGKDSYRYNGTSACDDHKSAGSGRAIPAMDVAVGLSGTYGVPLIGAEDDWPEHKEKVG